MLMTWRRKHLSWPRNSNAPTLMLHQENDSQERVRCLKNCESSPTRNQMTNSQHLYEVRPRKDKRGVGLISDALPFGRMWIFMLDRSLGFNLEIEPWAASGEDSS